MSKNKDTSRDGLVRRQAQTDYNKKLGVIKHVKLNSRGGGRFHIRRTGQ